jgi:hypothetical protein
MREPEDNDLDGVLPIDEEDCHETRLMLVFVKDLDPIRIGHLSETDLSCLPDVLGQRLAGRLPGSIAKLKYPQFDQSPKTIGRVLSIAPRMQYVEISNRH